LITGHFNKRRLPHKVHYVFSRQGRTGVNPWTIVGYIVPSEWQ
jgi:hypothetical protein